MIADAEQQQQQQQQQPQPPPPDERCDISTPRNSNCPKEENPDNELEPYLEQEAEDVFVDEGHKSDHGTTVAWTCAARAPTAPCLAHHSSEVFVLEQDDQPAKPEIDENRSPYLLTRLDLKFLKPDESVVLQYKTNAASMPSLTAVIERTRNLLTCDEAIHNAHLCRFAMVKELSGWQKHNAGKRMLLKDSNNLLRSKWVL